MFMPAGPPSIASIDTWAKRGLKAAGIELLGTGETQEIYLPAIGDSALDVISAGHYGTEVDTPENAALKKTLADMFGPNSLPDIASVAAWDGMRLIYEAVDGARPECGRREIHRVHEGPEDRRARAARSRSTPSSATSSRTSTSARS